ncbi:MAG: hypothetical protein F6K58_26290, partial [Symploca sp. SIO2E9]|nr:hypothetical protein [Symploca sp. SIO2E9]
GRRGDGERGRGGDAETRRGGDAERGRRGEGEKILMNFLPPAFRQSAQAEALCPLSPTLCLMPSVFLETVESAIPDAQKLSTSTNFSIVEN